MLPFGSWWPFRTNVFFPSYLALIDAQILYMVPCMSHFSKTDLSALIIAHPVDLSINLSQSWFGKFLNPLMLPVFETALETKMVNSLKKCLNGNSFLLFLAFIFSTDVCRLARRFILIPAKVIPTNLIPNYGKWIKSVYSRQLYLVLVL